MGLQTPDFAAPSFSDSPLQMAVSGSAAAATPDGLDAEMARLADLRRFASSVLKAAESQSQQATASAAWTDGAASGRLGASMFGGDARPSGLRDAASHQDRQDAPASLVPTGRNADGRRSLSVPGHAPTPPWEDDRRCITPRGRELQVQPPPQPPPSQAEWPGIANPQSIGRRRSSGQPLSVPWPAAGGSNDWEGSVKTEGRLVF